MNNMDLTIENIIVALNTEGVGSKRIVLNRLINATKKDLECLRNSIDEVLEEKKKVEK